MSTGSETRVHRIQVPGDKSVTHRALLFGALADGRSIIRNALASLDSRSTAECLIALGADVPLPSGADLVIRGGGLRGLRAPVGTLDCGNSGTTARHLLGLLAGCPFTATLSGDASLRGRPMRRVTGPLAQAGAVFVEHGESDRLPIEVTGAKLRPIVHDSPTASAQVKSALLTAAITGATNATVTEPHRSRDHTERMLRAMGAMLRCDEANGRARVRLDPPDRLEVLDLTVPGDFSSAAFFIAFALLARITLRIDAVGVNPTRTGMLDVLDRMGARIERVDDRLEGGEPVADLLIQPAELRPAHVAAQDVARMIDEIPALAILAARTPGETTITGAAELRVKESDRIAVIVANLRAIGVEAEEFSDGLVIQGSDEPLAGVARTHDDHRIAMAFGLLSAMPDCEVSIDDPAIAAVSDPSFFARLRTLAGGLT